MPLPTVSERPLMTTAEVAELWQVDPETVRRWGRDGKLTTRKTPSGRGTRFLRSEVYAFLGITTDENGPAGAGTADEP